MFLLTLTGCDGTERITFVFFFSMHNIGQCDLHHVSYTRTHARDQFVFRTLVFSMKMSVVNVPYTYVLFAYL